MLDRIASNDEELKELRLVSSPDAYFDRAQDLIDALSKNTNISYVRFDRDFLPGLDSNNDRQRQQKDNDDDDDNDLGRLLEAAGKLSALQEVHLAGGPVGAADLARLLRTARNGSLKVLDLGHLSLRGSMDDFTALEDALFQHPSLEQFHYHYCTIAAGEKGGSPAAKIDKILRVLGSIRPLHTVKLDMIGRGVVLEGRSLLTLLVRRNLLRELHVSRCLLDALGNALIAHCVRSSATLRTLSLPRTGMHDAAAVRLSRALERNGGSLDVLELSSNEIGDEGCAALAGALTVNKRVRVVRLYGNKKIGNAGLGAMADMLGQNKSIERLETPTNTTNSEYNVRISDSLHQNRAAPKGTAMAA